MPGPRPRPRKRQPGDDQDWFMLILESLSLGGMAVFVAMAAVLVLVGLYTYLVWPLTKWDLTDVSFGKVVVWGEYALGGIFVGGSAAGFWCFSGAAYRDKASLRRPSSALQAK